MKKTLSMILSILLVLNVLYACAIGASAEKSEIENLWAEKLEYDSKYFKPEDYENPDYEYYSPESLFAYETFYPYAGALSILLYTDKADELTFSRSYAVGEGLPAVGIVPLAPVFTLGFLKDECIGTWIYCEQFEKLVKPYADSYVFACGEREAVPYLRLAIQEFGITKEELYAAREKSINDSWSVKDVLSLTDEEVAQKIEEGPVRKGIQIPDFMIEALYLEDEKEADKLLLYPWVLLSDRGPFTPYDLTVFWETDRDRAFWEDLTVYADEKELERFIDYCTGYFQDGWKAHEALAILKEKTVPPQTGDPTAAYALIFTLAALPLAGFGVYEWKKRRRAV